MALSAEPTTMPPKEKGGSNGNKANIEKEPRTRQLRSKRKKHARNPLRKVKWGSESQTFEGGQRGPLSPKEAKSAKAPGRLAPPHRIRWKRKRRPDSLKRRSESRCVLRAEESVRNSQTRNRTISSTGAPSSYDRRIKHPTRHRLS